jgi:hypothetical protein
VSTVFAVSAHSCRNASKPRPDRAEGHRLRAQESENDRDALAATQEILGVFDLKAVTA